MRRLIAGMKISLDGKVVAADGYPEWVQAWSEDYDLTPQIDACLLGRAMYPDYERYWTAVIEAPDRLHPMTGALPTADEIAWARHVPQLPHYVLSATSQAALWPNTRFLRSTEDVAELLRQSGKDIYLVGGAETIAGLIDSGLVHELRLIVYPLVSVGGTALFSTIQATHALEQLQARRLGDGRVRLDYRIAAAR
ncbi:MAG: dihydrofolate reductase family protein [Sphingomonas sp.]|uniref:dihydrofolate reductase family protein n=1 Tax=Sphingomonas sp. TaxID=28214 RepID=UPI001B06B130|nr:dihydrofolate reductase family protein [Sphingomonas sp.]MBO9621568.1 dihydrofolate reductase family protein [Sphingomonas sp.]